MHGTHRLNATHAHLERLLDLLQVRRQVLLLERDLDGALDPPLAVRGVVGVNAKEGSITGHNQRGGGLQAMPN